MEATWEAVIPRQMMKISLNLGKLNKYNKVFSQKLMQYERVKPKLPHLTTKYSFSKFKEVIKDQKIILL